MHWRYTGGLGCLMAALWPLAIGRADWPQLHGNAAHDGRSEASLRPPFRLAWVREFVGERLGTAMEPIVSGGRVFVATHQGNLYALGAVSGQAQWRFATHGPLLHSPSAWGSMVFVGSADGRLHALEADTGRLRWSLEAEDGGFAAAPVVGQGAVFIGSRAGRFLAVEAATGAVRWRQMLPAPIRQTAALGADRVYVTAEDLRVRCFLATDGRLIWESAALSGQSARDYYPVAVSAGGRSRVLIRTNPARNMAQQIARDRSMLCREAGIDDSDWRRIEEWVTSDRSRGTPELWVREQKAVADYLRRDRAAQSLFVLDGETGEEGPPPPVLWIGGCQGVGAPAALTGDGRLAVLYRSAYGNWNLGVAPLVALGLLDLDQNTIEPLFHDRGARPPWNTFWGTADESQHLTVAGSTVFIVHQGTLSGFDLRTTNLFAIHGERDTFGGLRSPPWARNEWHGPARGGVAIEGNRVYWLTGSRLFCLAAGEAGPASEVAATRAAEVPVTSPGPPPAAPSREQLRQRLAEGVEVFLERRWAPLCVEPGLAGREFLFDHSGVAFESLAWAYPHLPNALQERTRAWVAKELETHPPFEQSAWYALGSGEPREWHAVAPQERTRLGHDRRFHPFGNVAAVALCVERLGLAGTLRELWPRIRASFDDFRNSGWRLDPNQGDLFANRYLASCLALAKLAVECGDPEAAGAAQAQARAIGEALIAWWERAGATGTLTQFKGPAELDPFIGKGDALSLRLAPHRHKLGLFHDLTPPVAQWIRRGAPAAADSVWSVFTTLDATWPLVGEERQVHFGENFSDPPDLAMDGFRALAWLREARGEELACRVDLPCCRADLYYLLKLALALE
ncbi:MAG TPA: PQQ-binding-like beta-propeller repeat protein [Verrucomicrobiota bacterium]|nr:PQQ-binding-like beta-propeller repeat protein [Verrucomicrobiota bacterium]